MLRPANDDGTIIRVTLRYFDLGMSPLTSDNVATGWVGVLDSIKSLLETGEPLSDLVIEPEPLIDDHAEHRKLAARGSSINWNLPWTVSRHSRVFRLGLAPLIFRFAW